MSIQYYHLTKEQLINHNFLELLSQLSVVDFPDKKKLEQHFNQMLLQPTTYVMVAIDISKKKDNLVGTASLFVRPTFLHGCSYIGYIEDVVVDNNYLRQGICKTLINKLEQKAREQNCYKTILSCKQENISVYEKCGYTIVETTMRKNLI